jgi:histidinol-phosphate/aromatic aminotransferase/cobyric acid decarboxylase-like protein
MKNSLNRRQWLAAVITFEARGGSARLLTRLQPDFSIGARSYQFLGRQWVRVNMGTRAEMKSLAAALKEIE